MSDYIHPLLAGRASCIVAVTSDVVIEYATSPDRLIRRGVYAFTSKKAARAFTTDVNRASEETAAYTFAASTGEKTNERQYLSHRVQPD